MTISAAGTVVTLERIDPRESAEWPPLLASSSPVTPAAGRATSIIDTALVLWGHPIGTLQTFSAAPASGPASLPAPLPSLFGRLSLRGPVELVIHLPARAHLTATSDPETPDPLPTGRPAALALVADLGDAHLRVAISGVTPARLSALSAAAPAPSSSNTASAGPAAIVTLDGGEYFFELRLASTAAAASIARPLNRRAYFRAHEAALAAPATSDSPAAPGPPGSLQS